VRAAPSTIPRLTTVGLDGRVLLVAAAATAVAALLFGLVPAIRYTRRGSLGSLRQGGRGSTADKIRHRGRRLLVVLQTAMTLVLLVGSGLLLRSFSRMVNTDLGFKPANVLTLRVALPRTSYADQPRALDFDRRLLEKLAALPGVQAAGAISALPMNEGTSGTAFVIDGRPTPPGQLPPIIHYAFTAPGYVETMGLTLVRGRTFDQRDLVDGSRDVLVNQTIATAFWPGADPIGKRLRTSGGKPDSWFTIVGVVASERREGLRRDPPMTIYWPLGVPGQDGARALYYVLCGPGVAGKANAVRDAVWALDPRLPVAAVRSMDEVVSRSIVPFTFTMLTLGLAAIMALLLGMIGLYGVLSYTVTLRFREIGVRLALGAAPARVMRAVVGQGLAIVGVGLVVGLAASTGLTRFLGELLYGTQPLDAMTFVSMSFGLLIVAALASYLPARRAAAISPMESIKNE
jgi:predicted permease